MNPKLFWLITAILLVFIPSAEAQQPSKVSRIGLLAGSRVTSYLEAFRQRMRDLGYIEGQNIGIEVRYADASVDRAADIAAEFVRLKVDVILTVGTQATLIVRKATSTIPIVVIGAGDLLGAGLVASLARPGGNVTGSTNIDPDLSAKRLDLLKESLPKLVRVAVLHHGGPGGDQEELKETQARAQILKIHLRALEVKDPNQFSEAYNTIKRDGADGLVIFHGSFTLFNRLRLIELSMNNRMPTMCGEPSWSEAGCLMSYGHDRTQQWRRAADFVDKIVKGTKPADLPVEQPTKFELAINLKTAKQINCLVWRGSRIDHLPNEHDDFCNAVGGAVHLASKNKTMHFGFPIAVGHVPKFGDGAAQDSRGGYYVGAKPWPTGSARGVDPWGKLPK